MSEDLNIFYHGGTGGFYFFHQLLLTNKFFCQLEGNSVEDIRTNQFNISDPTKWKSKEVWPDNDLTRVSNTNLRKIYLVCNDINHWEKLPGKKILLHTDLKTHIRMAFYKKSHWFVPFQKISNYTTDINLMKNLLTSNKNNVLSANNILIKKFKLKNDDLILLQDLLNPIGLEKTLNQFGCEISEKNIEFMNYYLSLHPKKLLEKIGIGYEQKTLNT